jgi:predicted MFS family arabinose efflux permease
VAAIAFAWKLFSLPAMPAAGQGRVGKTCSGCCAGRGASGWRRSSLFFMGQFALFTYLRPFLERVTGVGVSTLSLLLLLIGVAGFIGTTDRRASWKEGLYRTLIVIPLLMAAIAVALMAFGARWPRPPSCWASGG